MDDKAGLVTTYSPPLSYLMRGIALLLWHQLWLVFLFAHFCFGCLFEKKFTQAFL